MIILTNSVEWSKMDRLRCDLHIHTTASDGTWTPTELVSEAQKISLGVIAVTDHESIANVAKTVELARKEGIVVIPGVEISATEDGNSVHILGYGIDVDNQALLELLAYNNKLLEDKDDDSIRTLIDAGWDIAWEEYEQYVHNPSRGGFKSLSYLEDKGLCSGVADFFGRIFTAENNLSFPDFAPITRVIETIHGAGGLAFLAHGASSFHGRCLEDTLENISQYNFDGYECFHSAHSLEATATLVRYCQQHNKLISGGSDCHGSFTPSRKLGRPQIYTNDLLLGRLLK